MNTLIARTLPDGGTIGVVSPASPYNNYFGHSTHFATLPLGVQATLDTNACTLEVTEPALH
jgi:muramoyltetrapeptide carboxypeptidase LdcA involved in peptidoglycan recycling